MYPHFPSVFLNLFSCRSRSRSTGRERGDRERERGGRREERGGGGGGGAAREQPQERGGACANWLAVNLFFDNLPLTSFVLYHYRMSHDSFR